MPISSLAVNGYSERVRKSYTGRMQFLLAGMLALSMATLSFARDDNRADANSANNAADRDANKVAVTHPVIPTLSATYRISAGLEGDIYPVFANYASLQNTAGRKWGTVAVTINNPSTQTLHDRIAVKISGWSDDEIQTVDVPAGQSRTYKFAPSFL